MNFLLDNNLPPNLAAALDVLSADTHTVVALKDKFPANIADIDFMATLESEGHWAIITHDRGILRRVHERKAWQESGLIVFWLAPGWATLQFWVKAWKLVQRWPDITRRASRVSPPAGYRVQTRSTSLDRVSF